jgi:putative polyketide hydroxylase
MLSTRRTDLAGEPMTPSRVGRYRARRREVGEEPRADLGDRVAHAWTAAAGHQVSTLDLLGPGLTLFTGPERMPWEAAAAAVRGRLPVAVRSFEAITARALGIRADGALLVRPDGDHAPGSRPGPTQRPR